MADIRLNINPNERGKATVLINHAIAEVTSKPAGDIVPEVTFEKLEIDSLTAVEINMAIEEGIGMQVPEGELEKLKESSTVQDLYDIVSRILDEYAAAGYKKGDVVGNS